MQSICASLSIQKMPHPQLQHVHADSLTTDWFNRVTDTRQWQHRLKVVQEGQIQVESFQMKPLSGKGVCACLHVLYLSVCLSARHTAVYLCWSCRSSRGSVGSRWGKASSIPGPWYCIAPSVTARSSRVWVTSVTVNGYSHTITSAPPTLTAVHCTVHWLIYLVEMHFI